jgi:hypothetical protein
MVRAAVRRAGRDRLTPELLVARCVLGPDQLGRAQDEKRAGTAVMGHEAVVPRRKVGPIGYSPPNGRCSSRSTAQAARNGT